MDGVAGSETVGLFIPSLLGERVVGIGTDVIEVARIEKAIARNARFIDRVFTKEEIQYCLSASGRTSFQRFAVRFAAKEAVLKALGLGLGGASFHDIKVVRSPSGKPGVAASGRAANLAATQGVRSWRISLSHSDTIAQAFVLSLG